MYGGQCYQHSLVMASVIGSGWGELGGAQTSPFIPLTHSWCVYHWLAWTVSTHLPLGTGRQRGGQDVLWLGELPVLLKTGLHPIWDQTHACCEQEASQCPEGAEPPCCGPNK